MKALLCLLIIADYFIVVSGLSTAKKYSAIFRRDPVGRLTQLDRSKLDLSSDSGFYSRPNLVTHADDQCLQKVTNLYKDLLPDEAFILDIMSSHVSHLPDEEECSAVVSRLDVHGMNEAELQANPSREKTNGLFLVRNLNENPSFLGFGETACYDAVLCCCSVQYLEEPEQVFAEVARILKPGGKVIISFTNRFFPQKALTGWIERGMKERARLVTDYLRAAGGFSDFQIVGNGTGALTQLLSVGGIGGDPFVAVVGTRDDSP
eukprot:scaffold13509_cov157-Amphora_coffeaeformis.AAC.4